MISIQNSASAPALSPHARILGFFLGGCLFVLLALGLALISFPVSIREINSQTQITFTADRRSVFQTNDCVNLHWQVEGIKAVYIDDQATTGEGSGAFCAKPGDNTSTLRVVFQDDTPHDYPLTVAIISRSPVFWLFVTIAGLFFITTVVSLVMFWLNTRFKPLLTWLTCALRLAERLALILLIVFVLLELESHFYFNNFGTDTEKVRYIYSTDEILKRPAITLPMPYVNYVASPDYPGHNKLGYRGADIAVPKPAGTFRIVALGGSTTYSSATTAEEAYPAQLQNILRDQYGYSNVEVVNAGMVGYTSWDSLVNYMFRVTELEPDMLIIYDGVNDVEPRSVPVDCYQGLNPVRGINPRRAMYVPPKPQSISTLYRMFTLLIGEADDTATLTGNYSFLPFLCPGLLRDNSLIKDNPPIYFERNLRDIITLAKSNNTQVMFSTWTYSPVNELAPEWITAFGENNDIIRQLAAEYDLPLYDLDATDFGKDAAHWAGNDPIHMSANGTHEQASIYAAFIAEEGLIPKLGN